MVPNRSVLMERVGVKMVQKHNLGQEKVLRWSLLGRAVGRRWRGCCCHAYKPCGARQVPVLGLRGALACAVDGMAEDRGAGTED